MANTKDEEKDLGLSNQGMRWEDLKHGVWLTLDPIGYADGPNRYAYVHCNPITHFDPLGLNDVVILPPVATKDAAEKRIIKYWTQQKKQRVDDKKASVDFIHAKNVSDAKKQLHEYQKKESIEDLIFTGHGSEGSMRIGTINNKKDNWKKTHINKKNISVVLKDIKIKKGSKVRYEGCYVAKGEKGEKFLKETTKVTERKSEAYTGATSRKKVCGVKSLNFKILGK